MLHEALEYAGSYADPKLKVATFECAPICDIGLGSSHGIINRKLLISPGHVQLSKYSALTQGVKQVLDHRNWIGVCLQCMIECVFKIGTAEDRPILPDRNDNQGLPQSVGSRTPCAISLSSSASTLGWSAKGCTDGGHLWIEIKGDRETHMFIQYAIEDFNELSG